ncbi:SgcJ/EcaC family oxidoreductase [Streptomyces sp. NPDC059396]|uniref:SgcJ/EcaC family oxidoreductase n=1 Tax=Streptomyces sp. NPDC059396 TaxID=3346819 RepID=UPI0036A0DBC5
MVNKSVDAMGSISARMSEAWARGDATAFVADFADDADFVAFEGTVLKGIDEIVNFHQPLFDTSLKGSRVVNGRVVFARIIGDDWGVVHNRSQVVMPGQDAPVPSRDSMQILVVRWIDERWRVVTFQNSRVITLERQLQLDALESAAKA